MKITITDENDLIIASETEFENDFLHNWFTKNAERKLTEVILMNSYLDIRLKKDVDKELFKLNQRDNKAENKKIE